MSSPSVSVIMPVYNCDRFLREAINSVLSQTFGDFELIIINDGSTDDSATIIHSYQDTRIRVVCHNINKGLVYSRNEGIRLARAEYVAWLDSDDIAEPTRLEKQFKFLTDYPDIGLVGSWVSIIDEAGQPTGNNWQYETDSNSLPVLLLFKNRFVQSTVMTRREILAAEMYREEFPLAEDFELWIRISKRTKIANIPEKMVRYRLHGNNISHKRSQTLEEHVKHIVRIHTSQLGIKIGRREIEIHRFLGRGTPVNDMEELQEVMAWLKVLVDANDTKKLFNPLNFRNVLGRLWFMLCYRSTGLGSQIVPFYFSSPITLTGQTTLLERLKFLLKSITGRA